MRGQNCLRILRSHMRDTGNLSPASFDKLQIIVRLFSARPPRRLWSRRSIRIGRQQWLNGSRRSDDVAMLFAGGSGEAKELEVQLIKEAWFEPVDAGPLSMAAGLGRIQWSKP